MKQALRKFSKGSLVQGLLGRLISLYVRLAFATTRWSVDIPEETRTLLADGKPVLFAFWHGRLSMTPAIWNRYLRRISPDRLPMAILVSGHGDGDFADGTVRSYGIEFLRGSTTRGALAAAKAVLRCLKMGTSVAITVDGPKGPRMHMNSSITRLATVGGTAIIPLCFSVRNGRNMGSWDAMLVPFPFGKGIINLGLPFIPQGESVEVDDQVLEQLMRDQQDACDNKMDRRLIDPAPGS